MRMLTSGVTPSLVAVDDADIIDGETSELELLWHRDSLMGSAAFEVSVTHAPWVQEHQEVPENDCRG